MSKIYFNRIPKKPTPFPMFEFDFEIPMNEVELSCSFNDNPTFRSVLLGIKHDGVIHPSGEIKLYHSGTVVNYERTFDSAYSLALEIVKRFNSFSEKGQLCLEF